MHAVAGGAAIFVAAPAAFADQVDEAASKFAEASYPLVKDLNWVETPEFTSWMRTASLTWNPKLLVAFIEKVLEDGEAMDPGLIKAAVDAHERAIAVAQQDPKLLLPLENYEEVSKAIVRVIASAGPERSMGVYYAAMDLGIQKLNMDFMTRLNAADVAASYKAFVTLASAARQ